MEKKSQSGNVIAEMTEAERQIGSHFGYKDLGPSFFGEEFPNEEMGWDTGAGWSTWVPPKDLHQLYKGVEF